MRSIAGERRSSSFGSRRRQAAAAAAGATLLVVFSFAASLTGCARGSATRTTAADDVAATAPPPSSDFAGTLAWARTRSEAIGARAARIAAGKARPAAAAAAECAQLAGQNAAIENALNALTPPKGAFDPRTGLVRAIDERGAELAAGIKYWGAQVEVEKARAALPDLERRAQTLASEAAQNPGVAAQAASAEAEVGRLKAVIVKVESGNAGLLKAYRDASARAAAAASAWKAF